MMKHCFAYIRVSTLDQEDGASLSEQENLIARYAERQGLHIVEWFREVETAAKPGRPVFGRMMKLLRNRKAEGLIMHKIDRSSRNFHDWAQVNDLADSGIAVHFAGENLELNSRGKRLLADIQVVFATDYIRNLKEEIRKGIDGRLREGLVTWKAPLGYVDNGAGKKKTICPLKGPLVREAFTLYASGQYTLHMLADHLWKRGLRNQREGRLGVSGLGRILRNPFYIGIIFYQKRGTLLKGIHDPLISKTLFDEVGKRLQGKTAQKVKKHSFTYRRMFRCGECNHFLVPERQKGHTYYRCHTRACLRPCVREEALEKVILSVLGSLSVSGEMRERLEAYALDLRKDYEKREGEAREVWKCQLGAIQARENRLVDAYLEGALDRDTFEERKNALILEKRGLEEKLQDQKESKTSERLSQILELAFTASLSHIQATDDESRAHLEMLTSNRTVNGKNVIVELSFPFCFLSFGKEMQSGDPLHLTSRSETILPQAASLDRTLRHAVENLYNWVVENPDPPFELCR
jgi:site-specific DNA recombinase